MSETTTRTGFGLDASEHDRVDAPTREILQRIYGSVDLLADFSRATADSQYEDTVALEVIIGDLRAERVRLRAALEMVAAGCSRGEAIAVACAALEREA